MSIQVDAVHDLQDVMIRNQVERLYEVSPEFADGQHAIEQLDDVLTKDVVLYVARLDDKIIAAIWCEGQNEKRTLKYIVVHPMYRGRGIAEKLIDAVCVQEQQSHDVVNFHPGCGAIQRCLLNLGYI